MVDYNAGIFLYLSDFGEPLTLSWRTVRRSASGVVNHQVDAIRFLEQGRTIPACLVAMSKADAAVLTPDWNVIVSGESRPVLEVVDDRSGIVQVYLGDAQPC